MLDAASVLYSVSADTQVQELELIIGRETMVSEHLFKELY